MSKITRDQLAKFLPSPEAIRIFEKLFIEVFDRNPGDLEAIGLSADAAAAAATEALSAIFRVSNDAESNAAVTDAKANEALGLLKSISDSLALLSSAPPQREDAFFKADYIDFPLDGPHVTQERRLQWNKDDGTLDVGLFNGVVLQVGQEMVYYAKNTSGVTITDGSSVMATGAVGSSGRLTIAKAVSDGSVPARYMLGVATQNIAPNEFGYVTSFGLVRGINTTGTPYGETWAEGDLLYFNPSVPGGLTNVVPESPELKTAQAIVINVGAGGSGSIFVRMSQGRKVEDLDDVYAPAPAAGSVLIYDATQDRWESATLTPGTNVSITNADGAITIAVAGAAPTGAAGGVLSGTYPNPGFAVDMATQAELDAHTGNANNPHGVTAMQVGADPAGTAATEVSDHVSEPDPHTQYVLKSNTYSGTWTPTLSNVTNISASTAFVCQFAKMGDVVVFSGQVNIDPVASGLVELGVSIPVPSNFSANRQAGGTFSSQSGSVHDSGVVYADPTNDRLTFRAVISNTANTSYFFSGSYLIAA